MAPAAAECERREVSDRVTQSAFLCSSLPAYAHYVTTLQELRDRQGPLVATIRQSLSIDASTDPRPPRDIKQL